VLKNGALVDLISNSDTYSDTVANETVQALRTYLQKEGDRNCM